MTLLRCAPFLSAAAVQRQSSLAVPAAESVNLVDIPESSFHRCFDFIDSIQLPDSTPRSQRELKAPYWDRTAWRTSAPADLASP